MCVCTCISIYLLVAAPGVVLQSLHNRLNGMRDLDTLRGLEEIFTNTCGATTVCVCCVCVCAYVIQN